MGCDSCNSGSQMSRSIRPSPGRLLTMLTWEPASENLIHRVWGGQESAAGPGPSLRKHRRRDPGTQWGPEHGRTDATLQGQLPEHLDLWGLGRGCTVGGASGTSVGGIRRWTPPSKARLYFHRHLYYRSHFLKIL